MVLTGGGELGFDSEREPEKRLPHPRKAAVAQITQSTRGEVVTINNNTGLSESGKWNEYNLNPLTRIHWRASPVPAAALKARSWTLGWVDRSARAVCTWSTSSLLRRCAPGLNWRVVPRLLRTTAKAFAKDVFINQERKLGARRRSDTVLVSTINDADQGSADVAFRTPPAPYEKSKFLGSGGSMVARLKLKGIDGRAPPGVEPAA
ncbi:hypothetical protein H6P81_016056 [Aristolochia fimbriata]|uniref:Ribosomal protein L2 n=1 Tax=Aristolochia fimbriata TaxID=158543 RepID=A0AAV7EA47_ARIFI|nr:hypothetical protein H6P81_016056 [Aristolochia fimbriata]